MSDGIHDGYKTSEETGIQQTIAQELLNFLENPTPARMLVLKNTAEFIDGNSRHVEEIALRLHENNQDEWLQFHSSSAFSSQNDDFKNRFLANVQKRKISGF